MTSKISQLPLASAVASTDIMEITVNPATSPASRKVALTTLATSIGGIPEAPADGQTYTRRGSTKLWVVLPVSEPAISAGTTLQYWRGDKSFQTLDKIAVGLANVDNTSDAAKPISTATQTALDAHTTAIAACEPLGKYIALNDQTGTAYTFAAADAGKLVSGSNAAAITWTIPPNTSIPMVIGTKIDCWQKGTGQITFAPGAGVTIRSVGGKLKLTAQYSAASLTKVNTDEWLLFGDIAP